MWNSPVQHCVRVLTSGTECTQRCSATGLPVPNPRRRGPGNLVTGGNHRFLVDCGSGVVHRLVEHDVRAGSTLGHLLLTHLHSDHFIDLGHFTVTRWIVGDDRILHVYGPEGTREFVKRILQVLEPDIRMRMQIRAQTREMPNVRVHELGEGTAAEIDGIWISAFDVDHFPLEPPFGFRFDGGGRTIVFSGDTCRCEDFVRHANCGGLLVHECAEETWMQTRGSWTQKSQANWSQRASHTSPDELGMVARNANVAMLANTHMLPDSQDESLREAIAHSYGGTIVLGEDLLTC